PRSPTASTVARSPRWAVPVPRRIREPVLSPLRRPVRPRREHGVLHDAGPLHRVRAGARGSAGDPAPGRERRRAGGLRSGGEAAASVAASLPPFGIEPIVWNRIQGEASAIVTALEKGNDGDDDEGVIAGARALRDLLRHYV